LGGQTLPDLRRPDLQRLYSAFPGGLPGLGLLLLRGATGVALIFQASACLPGLQNLTMRAWIVCLLALGSGASLVLGFLTPIAGALAIAGGLGIMVLSPAIANWNFLTVTR
jgi:hypothetical protein